MNPSPSMDCPAAPLPEPLQSEECRLREQRDRAFYDLEAARVQVQHLRAQLEAARARIAELGELAAGPLASPQPQTAPPRPEAVARPPLPAPREIREGGPPLLCLLGIHRWVIREQRTRLAVLLGVDVREKFQQCRRCNRTRWWFPPEPLRQPTPMPWPAEDDHA